MTGFEEVGALLRHPALSSAWPERGKTVLHSTAARAGGTARTSDTVRRWFMFNDGARHRRLRQLMAPLFGTDQLAQLRPFIEEQVDELVDARRDRVDVMSDLAVPLSSRVICRLLGVPADVAPHLEGWAQDIAALLVADYLPEVAERGHRALEQVEDVVRRSAESTTLPEESGLALLFRAGCAGVIEDADMAAIASLIIYAGFETTSTFIGKAVRSALHANAWCELAGADAESSVEELLRFDTSVRQVARVATAAVDLSGQRIEAGDLVLLMLGAANRDPREFTTPDGLDLRRKGRRHLGFGYGSHYCLGAGLARLEVQILLRKLAARWQTAELVAQPTIRYHYGITVLEQLEIKVHSPHESAHDLRAGSHSLQASRPSGLL
ncbi:unspecific monooxygenase [Streptomyces antioxidans]|uniref:Unspecific monooxygenase n=1 Tax=Streptomyces antioxidans TaxID=1507734 RepID=A0A1V4CY16_9ACTN|nr:unspecific monooxygenase [Streptomyces antioxidans]